MRVSAAPPPLARAVILTSNHGEAGALTFFGRGSLPLVVSGHNSYFLWGPRWSRSSPASSGWAPSPATTAWTTRTTCRSSSATRRASRWPRSGRA
jgi:hypothetical protein